MNLEFRVTSSWAIAISLIFSLLSFVCLFFFSLVVLGVDGRAEFCEQATVIWFLGGFWC